MAGKRRKVKVAVVHCKDGSPILPDITKEELPNGCAAVKEAYPNGIRACSYGCLGGGDCVNTCRLHAIRINEAGVAEIDREKCVGCGMCIKACPQQIISFMPTEETIVVKCSNRAKGADARKECENSCITCGLCEKNCPAGAITVESGVAVINTNRCIACGMCAVKCPRGVIHDVKGILTASRS